MQKIIANVNKDRKEELWTLVKEAHRKFDSFLSEDKDIVLLERRPEYQLKAAEALLRTINPSQNYCYRIPCSLEDDNEGSYDEIKICYFPTYDGITEGALECLVSRLKKRKNIIEKLARIKAIKGSLISPNCQGRLAVEDTNAFKMLTQTEEACYFLLDLITNQDYPFHKVGEDNWLAEGKENGYRALHGTFHWKNGMPAMNDLTIKIHFTTIDYHDNNENGSAAHGDYEEQKMASPHNLDGYQVIIIEGDKLVRPQIIPTPYTDYVLIPGEVPEFIKRLPPLDVSLEESSKSFLLSI
ncbi:MAG: hypothetical protein ABIG93_05260 [archaeon]|nr:hypothetical protein [Nanoarchaeota archaeon]